MADAHARLRDARWRFWSFIHDVSGAIECAAEVVRMRSVQGMASATDFDLGAGDDDREQCRAPTEGR